MKKVVTSLFAAAIIICAVFILSGCYKDKQENFTPTEPNVPEYKVTYFDGEDVLFSVNCKQNNCAENYILEDKAGFTFAGWSYDGKAYIFESPVSSDLNLYAIWKTENGDITTEPPSTPEKPSEQEKPEDKNPETVTVNYYYGEKLLFSKQIDSGAKAENIKIEDTSDYIFTGWKINGRDFDFDKPVTQDTEVFATFTAVVHRVEFACGNYIVAVRMFTADNQDIDVPEVPEKEFYTGAWENFVLGSENLTVNAVYTPIDYTLTFCADGLTVAEFTYNAENRNFTEPEVPAKYGYTGKWEKYVLNGNITVKAEYTAIIYSIEFFADGIACGTAFYTIEDKEISTPSVPEKYGYTGAWEKFELAGGDMKVKAIYTPVEYHVSFYAENNLVDVCKYTLENKKITVPDVPFKPYFNAIWENYVLDGGDITVNAVYTPIQYSVGFYADKQLVNTQNYNVLNTEINLPDVPEKYGYTGVWENFELSGGDIKVDAVYTAIDYSIKFMASGNLVSAQTYTVENTNIPIPEVPSKTGYTGEWEKFSLKGGNIEINAVYTAISYSVEFYADGELLSAQTYTVESKDITIPEAPKKFGYEVKWQDFELTLGNLTVNAEYTPVVYTVYFFADDVMITHTTYTVENTDIEIPEVPVKNGFEGKWEHFTLDGGDKTVKAIYTSVYHNIYYYADGKLVYTVQYADGDLKTEIPPVPQKKGYTGKWENFALTGEDITVNAEYSLIEYNVFFYADNILVKTVKYTVNDTAINIPKVPVKEGYTGKWPEFELGFADIMVNAIYTKTETPVPPAPAENPEADTQNLQYTSSENGLVITGYKGNFEKLYIPAEIDGKNVYAIGKNAFMDNKTVTELTIGEGIEIIEATCFQNCHTLQKIVLPNSLKEIAASAFDCCYALTTVEFGNGLTSIGRNAFANCTSLEEITIPDSVQIIDVMAFANCTKLKTVYIGQNVEQISAFAFRNTALVSVIFKNTTGWNYSSAQLSDASVCAALLKNGTELKRS